MYFDDAFKKMIRKKGETFTELKNLLDQYNEVPAINNMVDETTLAQTLESYMIQLLVYLSRQNREVDFREVEFVSILLQKNLSKETIKLSESKEEAIDLDDPNLFVTIRMLDKDLAKTVIDTIENIGLLFIAVDGHSDIREIKALTDIIFEIRHTIRSLDKKSEAVHEMINTVHTPDESEQDMEANLAELNELIGLEQIKAEIAGLINLIKVRKLREEQGLPVLPMSFHLVFSGNPGTGKTTVARILAKIYKNLGVISKGDLVEVDRSGLVAGFVGQTAIKVSKVIESAKGGVLFIDEAYSLTPGGSQSDYGSEAIEVLFEGDGRPKR